jgi:hypothetical protein
LDFLNLGGKAGKSWRPTGRQLGRQLSPREIWTYGTRNELAANSAPTALEKLAANWPATWPSTFS